MTTKQAHVLANLDRVVPLASRSALPRYQLDGVECTAQIKGLAVRKLIGRHSTGHYIRLRPARDVYKLVGERQAPLPRTVEAIKSALAAPATVRSSGTSRR